jgi:exo-beta-1,3-glucanase (GH17 family)
VKRLGATVVVLVVALLGRAQADPSPPSLTEALATVRFVAYTPRGFSPDPVRPAGAAGIREDLERLRPYFDGLILYSATAGHEHVPAVARALGYRAVVLGVWDPGDEAEVASAVRLARAYRELVVSVAVGNEGLFWRRYDWATLARALARVRAELPGVPATTTEPFAVYLDDPPPGFLEAQDLLLPNVHPTFEPWFRPERLEQAADFVTQVVERLAARAGRPVLVKETGIPAGPAERGYNEARQAELWRRLRLRLPADRNRAFAYFEAFDAPWKPVAQARDSGTVAPEEAYWGLFDVDGRPRPAARELPALPPGLSPAGDAAPGPAPIPAGPG